MPNNSEFDLYVSCYFFVVLVRLVMLYLHLLVKHSVRKSRNQYCLNSRKNLRKSRAETFNKVNAKDIPRC